MTSWLRGRRSLTAAELAEAAVLGDVALVLSLAGWFLPLSIVLFGAATVPFAVLGLPERGCDVRRPLRPAMDAVPGEVQLAADEPGRPLRPAGQIDHPVPRT